MSTEQVKALEEARDALQQWKSDYRLSLGSTDLALELIDAALATPVQPADQPVAALAGAVLAFGHWAEGLPVGSRLMQYDGVPATSFTRSDFYNVPLCACQPTAQQAAPAQQETNGQSFEGGDSLRDKRLREAMERADQHGPLPGMISAFENQFGVRWTEPEWKQEASVWAAAWGACVSKGSRA